VLFLFVIETFWKIVRIYLLEGIEMNKRSVLIVLLTVAVEFLLVWGVCFYMDWSYIDVSSIGGIAIFGLDYLTKFNSYQVINTDNPTERVFATTVNERQPFSFKMNPVRTGMLLYATVSFGIAVMAYLPYFID